MATLLTALVIAGILAFLVLAPHGKHKDNDHDVWWEDWY